MLARFDREVLEYMSPHPLSFFEDRRTEYLGLRTQGASGKYGQFMDGIRNQFKSDFGNRSPNPYSTRIFSSDGQKLVVAFQYAAPLPILQENQHAVISRRWPDVSKQPKKQGSFGFHHLIPVGSTSRTRFCTDFLLPSKETHRILALQGTQTLLSVVPLEKVQSNRRHGDVDASLQKSHYFVHCGWDGTGPKTPERIGNLHVVACWPQQGHSHQVSIS